LELDRKFGGETLVALHIAGKNPDFYGGYPVEFNLNLTGKLDQILIQSLAGYRIPKTLEDSLKQSPGGSANTP
jgi:Dicarboxylate transport.